MSSLVLAPMEGLTDFHMRDVLTRLGHYDWCVTEFIRVTDGVHSSRVFFHACPELHTGGLTASGTPVHVQLLGSDKRMLAMNADRAVRLGALAIDLNFGCPAKKVNNHGGGAILLDTPETVHAIVAAVRAAVPADVPVSAKMRLGVKDRSRMIENAQGIEAAGAAWLTVHARTKEDGYRPPAHWEAIAEIRERVPIQVIANGEVWSREDAQRCREVSGCTDLMLGRGAVTRPDLVNRIRHNDEALRMPWEEIVLAQLAFLEHMEDARRTTTLPSPGNLEQEPARWTERGAVGRYKQWLGMMTRGYAEAVPVFEQVKHMRTLTEVRELLTGA
ncbi:MAG: tRNA-dihydrouridine synthase [Moraxellaceae bacterium]|nr:tRNA-dihydrouridine synthase [Moraxellaceae bacterium]MBP9730145.1 tRNA-dihydrouridine synthase [Moraxellaceae bacterium]MCC6201207.1 tRNA-dihydrouridine synthase [Moraxellaceae bacterium]HQV41465.1 tRNA-dihydrouridine synthase [Moraxellaceae bacterium]HQX90098.1 tRNA-dihydrouridine synthase [Moraxellaceae bacterium]